MPSEILLFLESGWCVVKGQKADPAKLQILVAHLDVTGPQRTVGLQFVLQRTFTIPAIRRAQGKLFQTSNGLISPLRFWNDKEHSEPESR